MTEEKVTRRPLTTRDTKWAAALARGLAGIGLRPNQISSLSLLFAGGAGTAFVFAGRVEGVSQAILFLAAAAGIQLRLLCNMLDGMVAVEGGFRTKTGELYNELPDRFADVIILVCAGYALPAPERIQNLGWLAAVLAVITAYVRALGVSAGAAQHFVGPMAKPHRMAALTAASLAMAILVFSGRPVDLVHPMLGIISFGCLVTVARRLCRIADDLKSK